MTFRYVLNEAPTEILFALKSSERVTLINAFRAITDNPQRRPDFILRQSGERDLQVAKIGVWHITYWVDHFAAEVRIHDVRRADRKWLL
jgi:hypothetical protein